MEVADTAQPTQLRAPRWLVWLGFVLFCNGVGFLSSLAGTEQAVYRELVRPSWSPPPIVFGPVWTTLYTMMATAVYLIWTRTSGRARRTALTVFGLQLALNAAWTPVFFGAQAYGAALVVIGFVFTSVAAMMVVFWRRVRFAGALILPLWLWCGFATALNAAIWWLNR